VRSSVPYERALEDAPGEVIEVGGRRVHCVVRGEGEPLLLVHGFLFHSILFRRNIDALAARFRVHAVDLWGWGYSERLPVTEYGFATYGEQLVGLMDALGLERAALCGQSLGGAVAVHAAAHHPDRVTRLVLVAPAAIPHPLALATRLYRLPVLGELANALPGDLLLRQSLARVWFHDRRIVTRAYARQVLEPMSIVGSLDGAMYVLRHVLTAPYVEPEVRRLADRDLPILLVHGRQDRAVPLATSRQLDAGWPTCRLVVFDDAGHCPNEEHPERFDELVAAFLVGG